MVFGVSDSEDEDDIAAGETDLRLIRSVLPINRGSATSAVLRATRSPAAAARPAVSRVPDNRRLSSAAISATCILPLSLFQPA